MNNDFIKFIFLLIPVYIIGFGIDIMDIDASQYAEMSREMSNSNSYLQVYEIGKDYLDKPPLLFWVTSLSIKILGANNFAYRLPSFLFALLALFSTYKFALLYYKKEIAALAALVLASCQAFFLINHDVRTDTILMSCVVFSIWQLATWLEHKKTINFVLAFVGIGLGMLAKGPIALIVPVLAFGTHCLLARNFSAIFKWQYLIGIVIIAIVLLPMSIGLYTQFDVHPEKIVNEKTGVSGLRFFYWTQSFGRVTGESVWNNNSNIFFLFQNMLWSFLPWILIFSIAFFTELKLLIQQKFKIPANAEWICMGGFTLGYLALGSSKYQLPHYIFVVFPFAAIITAKFLYKLYNGEHFKMRSLLEKSHFIIFSLLHIALSILLVNSFPAPIWLLVCYATLLGLFYFYFSKNNVSHYLIKLCVFSFLLINLFLNAWVYPAILKYQAGNTIGRFINKNNLPLANTFIYQEKIWHSIHYYSNEIIGHKDTVTQMVKGDYIILKEARLVDLVNAGKVFDVIYKVPTYGVSRLQIKFLIPGKRSELTEDCVIIKIR
ncbi:MAG: ArnT family glycosyltransferase [Ferruginibacter sp.]